MPDGSNLSGIDPAGLLKQMQDDWAGLKTERSEHMAAFEAAQAKAQEAAPQPVRTPAEDYSGVAMAIAALGGALTHTPLTVAAQSMAGVLDAYNKGDAEKSKTAYEQWKANHDAAMKAAELELKAYQDAGREMVNDPRGYQAQMLALTSAYKNMGLNAMAQEGRLVDLTRAVRGLAGATKGAGKAASGFEDVHTTHMGIADAEKAVADAAQSGDKDAYAAAIDKLNEARNELATQIEAGLVKPRKGVTLAELRKPIPGGTQSGGLSDEAARLIAQQQLEGNQAAAAGWARSPADKRKIANMMVEENDKREHPLSAAEINAKVAEFEGTKSGERTLGTRTANMEIAANEARNMIPLALSASRAVNRSDYPTLNQVLIAAKEGTGDENVVRFGLAANSLIYTYAKFLNPTGIPTDADKAKSTEILSRAWAEGQFEAALDQIQKEIQSGRAAVTQTRGEFREGLTGQTAPDAPPAATPPKYQAGQTATNPKTGEKLVFKGGEWVPQ